MVNSEAGLWNVYLWMKVKVSQIFDTTLVASDDMDT